MPDPAAVIVEEVEKVVEKVGEVIAGPFPAPSPTPAPTPVPSPILKTTSNKYLWYIVGGVVLVGVGFLIYKSMQAKTPASNKE
jgi:hypothetical protein